MPWRLPAVRIVCAVAAIAMSLWPRPNSAASDLDPCFRASRYQMPPEVETGAAPKGVAGAELPGTSPELALPDEIAFPLRYQILADPKYHDTNLELGEVSVGRAQGDVKLDGIRLSDLEGADLAARCAEARARRARAPVAAQPQ